MESNPEQEQGPEAPEPAADASSVLFASDSAQPAALASAEANVPEDLRVPWDWMDIVLFFFFGLGSVVLVAQGLQFAFAVFFAIGPKELRSVATWNTAFAVTHQVAWSLVMLGFLWVQVRVRSGGHFWRTMGFRTIHAGGLEPTRAMFVFFGGGMVLAVGVQIASVFLRTPANLPIEGMFQTRESVLMMMAAGILVAPLVEEVMFRGFLYPVFARKLGAAAGVLIVGLLFGLMHAAQLWGGWGQIGLLILVGIILTYARARTGSVLASYLLHLGYNTLLLLGFYLATGGLKNLPTSK